LTRASGAWEGRALTTGKEAAVASEDKIREGARPFLEDGEEVLAAFVARPRGWTQAMAGSMHLGLHQQGKHREGAEAAGFALASPMALAITDRRLLSFSMGAQAGMGIGGGVKELVGEAALLDVDSIRSKRLLMGKVVEVSVRGESFKLEAGAGANVKGVVEAFERARAAA
jgi:hypothetical protein